MEESLVSKVLRDLTANGNGKVLLLEPLEGLLYSNTNQEETEQLMHLIGAGDPQYAKMNGVTYLFVRHRLEPAGFTLYGGVSLEEIQRKNKDIIHIFVVAGIVGGGRRLYDTSKCAQGARLSHERPIVRRQLHLA